MRHQIPIGKNSRNLFSTHIWSNGELYARHGRVRILGSDSRTQTADFAVIGNGGRYSVQLRSPSGGNGELTMSCDCSAEGRCKHMAAALISGLEESVLTEEPVLSADYRSLILNFREESRTVRIEDIFPAEHKITRETRRPIPQTGGRLVFLLETANTGHPDFRHFLEVVCCFQPLKKDGQPGRLQKRPHPGSFGYFNNDEERLHYLIESLPSSDRSFLALLPDFKEAGIDSFIIITNNGTEPLELSVVQQFRLEFEPASHEGEILFRPVLDLDGESLRLEDFHWENDGRTGLLFLPSEPKIRLFNERFTVLRFLDGIFTENFLFSADAVRDLIRNNPSKRISIVLKTGSVIEKKTLPKLKFYIKPNEKRTEIHPGLCYGRSEVGFYSASPSVLETDPDGSRILYVRDRHVEKALILTILELDLKDIFQDDPLIVSMPVRDFILEKGPRILEQGGEVLYKDGKKKLSREPLSFRLSSGLDWLDVKVSVGGRNVSVKSGVSETGILEYEGGFKVLSEKELEKLIRLQARDQDGSGGVKAVSYDLDLLSLLEDDIDTGGDPRLERMTEAVRLLKNGSPGQDFRIPAGLNAQLRPYQTDGAEWLSFLYRFRLGGILADDMGLGKTVQTITLLLHAYENRSPKPFLVVAPVSTLTNWQAEIRRFAPDLTPYLHIGSDRSEWTATPGLVVLTSYHTLMRDEDAFLRQEWDIVVLDESQALKNHQSQSSKAVRSLNGRRFLALSGTPLENHIGELWSIMNLLNPGLLGSRKSFLSRYKPAFQRGDDAVKEELKRRIAPFLLRRRKTEVASDLPPREEIVLTVTPSAEEQRFYEQQKTAHLEEMKKLRDNEAPAFQISSVLLQALNSLRQTAISPELRNGPAVSTKLDVAVEKILEAADEDHKVLVFSQFVRVLDLLKPRLEAAGVVYEFLDGSMTSKRRESAVRNFRKNDEVKAFLISLKAGGTGLNLVEADYVIILDPWWNPAIENQAIDRSHRIGQTQPVTAYKIIAENTVEEKVLELQRRKQLMADEILEGASSPLQRLSAEEIAALF